MSADERMELPVSVPHFSYSQKCLAEENVGKCDRKYLGNLGKDGALLEG